MSYRRYPLLLLLAVVLVTASYAVHAQEFWCEGLDDDGDGEIDEGCDRTCVDPYALGDPVTLGGSVGGGVGGVALLRHGSGLLVAYDDSRSGVSLIYTQLTSLSGASDLAEETLGNGVDPATDPAIAWSESGFAVVWVDQREGNAEIYVRDLDANGVPTSLGTERAVSASNGDSLNPAIIWSGTEYLVAWDDLKGPNRDIYVRRLDQSGNTLASAQRITTDGALQERPALTWDGSQYGLAWTDYRHGDAEIYAIRLDATGAALGTETRITNASGASDRVSLRAIGPGNFGLVWEDARDGLEAVWYAAWDAPAYVPIEAAVSASSSAARAPTLATSGAEVYVVWEDLRHGDGEAYLARLDPTGSVLSGDLRLTVAEGAATPSTAWHGNGVVAAYPATLGSATSEVRLVLAGCCLADQDADGLRVCDGDCGTLDGAQAPGLTEVCDGRDTDCNGQDDEGCPGTCTAYSPSEATEVHASPSGGELPSLEWNGNGYGVAWLEIDGGERSVFFRLLDSNGIPVSNPVRLSPVGASAEILDLQWNGKDYGVVWDQSESQEWNIRFRRVDNQGQPTGPVRELTRNPVPLSFGYGYPSLSWNGETYGLAFLEWETMDSLADFLHFMRLDREGRPLDRQRKAVTDPLVHYPDLVQDGNDFALAYASAQDPFLVRLDSFGGRLADSVELSETGDVAFSTSVAVAPWGYGVIWIVSQNNSKHYQEVDPQGFPVGVPVNIQEPFIGSFDRPQLNWIGSEFVVVSELLRQRVSFVRIDRQGQRTGPDLRIDGDPTDATKGQPSLAWNGQIPAIAWGDTRTLGPGMPRVLLSFVQCCESSPALPQITGLMYDDPTTLSWADAGVERYDRVLGDLLELRSQSGDYTGTHITCENDIVGTTTTETNTPPIGEATYTLLRGDGFCAPGSYHSGGAGQQADRDSGLANVCP